MLIDVGGLVSSAPGKDIGASGVRVRLQEIPGALVQRSLLVLAAFVVPDMDEAPVKIHILPFQPEEFPPPHASVEDHPHEIGGLDIGACLYRLQQGCELVSGQIFSLDVVHLGHFDDEGRGRA